MTHPFPPPPIKPLTRLQALDGLLINAERWRKAHEYHRLRQNVHYQSLHQPGIVCGLGVRVIAPPSSYKAEYRDNRWVEIQPGVAIDVAGNVIVVPNALEFRVTTEVPDAEPVMVYLVVSYVDPDQLQREDQSEYLQETFRLDEKRQRPEPTEIELCRIFLQPGPVSITQPADAFYPGYNNVDLRYRIHAQIRPQAIVRMALVSHSDPEYTRNFFNLSYLQQSVEVLYPSLKGSDDIGQVSLEEYLLDYDLLYLTGKQALALNSREFDNLKAYLDKGGTLLVDASLDASALIESTQTLAQQLDYPLKPLEELRRSHPLRTKPFLFAGLPIVNQQPIQMFSGGGIILVIGDLATSWGLDQDLTLSRFDIRTAQELGINILQYAWRRRQLIGLQQEDYSGLW